ncbi:MAG: VPLPA-CTERM sorting domain-containing protein [Gammaproteobacteria bacterium]
MPGIFSVPRSSRYVRYRIVGAYPENKYCPVAIADEFERSRSRVSNHNRRNIMFSVSRFAFPTVALAVVLGVVAVSPSAQAVPLYYNGFETDIAGWNAFGGAFDATRVPSGTGGVTSSGGSFHAVNSATGSAGNWGGYNYGAGNAVPTVFQEYQTSVDIYLDVGGGWANDTRFDFSSAVNNNGGTFKRDFIFNAGFYNDTDGSPGSGTSRFVITASNNSQPGSAYAKNPGRAPIAISTTGWYTFQHRFYDSGGVLAVDLSIYDAANLLINSWTLSDPGDVMAGVGGNRYGWFDYNEFSTLAFDNAELNIVPIPAAVWLFGSALGVLRAIRRRPASAGTSDGMAHGST